jgi:hypothetical protein
LRTILPGTVPALERENEKGKEKEREREKT